MQTVQTLDPLNLDWSALIQEAAPYTDLVSATDPVSGLVDVTYYGLKTCLSDVLKAAPATGAHSVAIFADTLLLDVADFTTSGLLLVVRNLDVSGLNGKPLMITPGADGEVVAQILVGASGGGTFSLNVQTTGSEDAPVTPPVGTAPLTVTTYLAPKGGPFSVMASTGNSDLVGLISSSWMMNSLYASFSAAAWLMDDSSAIAQSTSQAMLAWVVGGTACLETNNNLPSDYSQLYNQAAALLVTLNVAPGATFVPALSGTYYSQHMSDIITVIGDYETKMNVLDTETDIAKAIATVTATLQSVASDEITPLQVQLDSISTNTQSLFNDIVDLRGKFGLQTMTAETYFKVMIIENSLDQIREQLKAIFEMGMSVMSLGFDAVKVYEGDVGALKDAIEDAVKSIEGLVNTIESFEGGESGTDLSAQAVTLFQTQMAMMQTVLNARLLWEQALNNQSGGVLPASLSAITIDPVTDWDNYLASAEAAISILMRGFGTAGQNAADNYLASLKILAGYGKAIGGKFVAYVAQLVQASIVMAQIKAAKDVEKRWEEANNNATSDVEKLAALKALVQGRLQAIKRSLYVAWTYYAASYFYLNFQSPPHVLHMDMDAAAIQAALVGVSDWVAQAIGNAPDGQHILLPSDNAKIELDFAVVSDGGIAVSGTDTAFLTKADDGSWSLVFTVPLGTQQLQGVLPDNGNVAIWISEAAFFLDGVTPNTKGNVIASISTSGTYQNGVGANESYTFVTKGLTGNYAYQVSDNTIYSPWAINTAVYMTPTPYTQWNMTLAPNSGDPSTATLLRVKLTIAYMS